MVVVEVDAATSLVNQCLQLKFKLLPKLTAGWNCPYKSVLLKVKSTMRVSSTKMGCLCVFCILGTTNAQCVTGHLLDKSLCNVCTPGA